MLTTVNMLGTRFLNMFNANTLNLSLADIVNIINPLAVEFFLLSFAGHGVNFLQTFTWHGLSF